MAIRHFADRDVFTVTNVTKGTRPRTATVYIPANVHVWYPHGGWFAYIDAMHAPSHPTVVLWEFRNCQVATEEGVQRGIFGRWNTTKEIATNDVLVVMGHSEVRNNHDFDIILYP
jgi:hypothetical protein